MIWVITKPLFAMFFWKIFKKRLKFFKVKFIFNFNKTLSKLGFWARISLIKHFEPDCCYAGIVAQMMFPIFVKESRFCHYKLSSICINEIKDNVKK